MRRIIFSCIVNNILGSKCGSSIAYLYMSIDGCFFSRIGNNVASSISTNIMVMRCGARH